jgi:hypothetical protein
MNYFSVLCFVWAAVGIVSRIMMAVMGRRWSTWETEKAYTKERPPWVVVVAIAGLFLIVYTWYRVFTGDVNLDWVIASLISLTALKVSMLLFKYDAFHEFLVRTLSDRSKMMRLNIVVILFSCVLVAMGIFIY